MPADPYSHMRFRIAGALCRTSTNGMACDAECPSLKDADKVLAADPRIAELDNAVLRYIYVGEGLVEMLASAREEKPTPDAQLVWMIPAPSDA